MENESSQSLVAATERGPPQPAHLYKYQDKFIASLDAYNSSEEQWLPTVCGNSRTQVDRLLDRWSRLRKFQEDLDDAAHRERARKTETQQAFVESDSEEDILPKATKSIPARPGSVQPLFTETATLPIPVPTKPSTIPLTPASSYGVSPQTSRNHVPPSPSLAPTSPRTSIGSLPVEAEAAVEAKEIDDDVELEIPWTLYRRGYYWRYIDGKIQETNTDAPSSEALSDRQSWTEILASWVCKEAIREAGYHFTQMQKERRDGRRTKFDTCFRIEKGLTFNQVRQLVERTVEIYRKRHAPSPPPRERTRRESFDRRPAPKIDHDRTPLANKGQPPPLDRPITAFQVPPPPPLDRAMSMPGQVPTYPPNPRSSNLYLPQTASPPQTTSYFPQAVPPPPRTSAYTPKPYFPPPPSVPYQPPNQNVDPRLLQANAHRQWQAQPARHRHDKYASTSESDSVDTDRDRKHRSRTQRDGRPRKKEHSGANKALMGVVGLTALLDGLVGI
jgi:hypothetical protein